MKKITDKIYDLYNKFGSIPFLIAIRRAFTFLIPVFIIVLVLFPFNAFR